MPRSFSVIILRSHEHVRMEVFHLFQKVKIWDVRFWWAVRVTSKTILSMFRYSKRLYVLKNVFLRSFDIFRIFRQLFFRPSNIDDKAEKWRKSEKIDLGEPYEWCQKRFWACLGMPNARTTSLDCFCKVLKFYTFFVNFFFDFQISIFQIFDTFRTSEFFR